jgi:hypothetical protein
MLLKLFLASFVVLLEFVNSSGSFSSIFKVATPFILSLSSKSQKLTALSLFLMLVPC